MNNLEKARSIIDQIDGMMIQLFKDRMEAVKIILEYKKANNLPVFDEKRELELLNKNIEKLDNKELEDYYKIFFSGILNSSKKYQENNYE